MSCASPISKLKEEMPEAGFEPARLYRQGILSPQRLPFRHSGSSRAHHIRKLGTDFEYRISNFGFPTSHPRAEAPDSTAVLILSKQNEESPVHVAEKAKIIYPDFMETAKLGKRGQVSIPKAVLEQLGIEAETILLVEATEDGSILLRPAGVYPIEIYSDARVAEFMEEDRIDDDLRQRIKKKLEGS